MAAEIRVEIVYAEPQRAVIKTLSLPRGASLADALLLAAQEPNFNSIDFANAALGIHGQPARRDQLLSDGDRIEIYRPLKEDPKAARRQRARSRA